MNKEYLKKLTNEVEIIETTDIENETRWKENFDKRFGELSKNLDETIEYLDKCNANELSWTSELFEELIMHFKSKKLIDCVERNVTRFENEELQNRLKMELEYMKEYLNK